MTLDSENKQLKDNLLAQYGFKKPDELAQGTVAPQGTNATEVSGPVAFVSGIGSPDPRTVTGAGSRLR